ncbi:MAG TPA: hypothetical protein H9771_00595 [Candidatus Faecalibacterium faecipullorum]|uniref:Uncharacterized protein n=1 Tax=Candidatus Faecalibacterium faecipullorum TaxID=2838578 RepID=A0A9D2S5W9_9FIRM|nr:hypothetical protein [Candidatus Faecalibacterium faecipullorum]
MKLKKIASLMLAGIMAVSMLAGCKSGTTTDDEKNPVVPVASNAVKYVEDALDSDWKDMITVSTSSDLDSWVKDFGTNASKVTANKISSAYRPANLNGWDIDLTNDIGTKLKEQGLIVSDDFDEMPENYKSQSFGWIYLVSGKLDEKAAVEDVVDILTYWGTDYGNTDTAPVVGTIVDNGTVYNCDYDVNVSTLKVTNDSLTGETAWVVGIVMTQNVTKASNVEA